MSRKLTPQDAHVLMNLLVHQATGQTNITVTDTSSFVSAGELVLSTGVENTMNALSMVLGRTLISVRPYKAKLNLISAENTGEYTHILRDISYYSRDALASGAWNTNAAVNLAAGFTNGQNKDADGKAQSTKSQWEQNPGIPLEMNFGGSSVWQDSTTVYKYQLKEAFRDEASFNAFAAGILTEKANDIESQKEAFNRMTLLNFMAGIYDLEKTDKKGRVVNLTKAYNDKFGTSYTSHQLRTTYLDSFLKFFVATFKTSTGYLEKRSAMYHWTPEKKDAAGNDLYILRHTPKASQNAILYKPLFVEAEAQVMPSIFNDEYLKIDNFEGVDYWQAFTHDGAEDNAKINVVPAIPQANGTQGAGDAVEIPYVVGMIFDKEAIKTDFQLEDADATPMEARKKYYNIWWDFSKNSINNFTKSAILFIMEDEGN